MKEFTLKLKFVMEGRDITLVGCEGICASAKWACQFCGKSQREHCLKFLAGHLAAKHRKVSIKGASR